MEILEIKLTRIIQHSSSDKNAEFKWLIQHYNPETLASCFRSLYGKKASGIDKITKNDRCR